MGSWRGLRLSRPLRLSWDQGDARNYTRIASARRAHSRRWCRDQGKSRRHSMNFCFATAQLRGDIEQIARAETDLDASASAASSSWRCRNRVVDRQHQLAFGDRELLRVRARTRWRETRSIAAAKLCRSMTNCLSLPVGMTR